MAGVAVLIPWRPSPSRAPVLDWVTSRWADLGWPVVLGECLSGPWCKAAAVGDALSHTDAGVLVVADADVWCDAAVEAVTRVSAGEACVMPHRQVWRLSRAKTARVLAGEPSEPATQADLEDIPSRNPYPGMVGGGIVVIRRDAYLGCPLDPRFLGWGQEDASWGTALARLHGLQRGTGDLWHLWHEPEPRMSFTRGNPASVALAMRYASAKNTEEIRAIIGEIGTVNQGDEPGMYVYRNLRDRNIADVRTPVRIPRLERLGNWELVESPAPPLVAMDPAPVVVELPTGWVPTPENPILVPPDMESEPEPEPVVEVGGTGEPMEPVEVPADEPEVEVVAAPRPLMPKQPDSKALWETYARAVDINPDGLTKAQLIAACRRAR